MRGSSELVCARARVEDDAAHLSAGREEDVGYIRRLKCRRVGRPIRDEWGSPVSGVVPIACNGIGFPRGAVGKRAARG